jgi:putative flippase GtrA
MELTEQMLRFVVAGTVVTVVDFLIYNLFLRYVWRRGRVLASIVSVTLAMACSFTLNRFWVFSELQVSGWPVAEFLAVTLVSAYGIQSGVIYLLSRRWRAPAGLVDPLSEILRGNQTNVADFIERNAVKLAAVGTGLVWNFSWYRWYVFAS